MGEDKGGGEKMKAGTVSGQTNALGENLRIMP